MGTPFLQADTDAEILNAHAEEVLVTKEGSHDGWDAGT
jgi:hypothetical protein